MVKSWDELDPSQKEVASLKGIRCITAAAGTGKTSCLLYCASKTERPLILSFSNRDAEDNGGMTVHSFCHSLIGGEIWTPQRCVETLYDICCEMKVANPYETAKHEYLQTSWRKCLGLNVLKTPWYEEFEKEKGNACDFDDLLIRGLDYVTKNDIRKRFGGIYVDEWQDLNTLMYQIITKIIGDNAFVIGDPLQSIYAWRDAHPAIFDDFKKDFNPAIGSLIHDHRHGKEIVDVLEWFYPRGIIPCGPPARVEVVMCVGAGSEELFIIKLAKELGDSDILCRYWKPLTSLANAGLPSQIIGDPSNECDIPAPLMLRKPIARLRTIHGSKGATFLNTIVMGVSENDWIIKNADINEEERIFYVAISRAKNSLFITHQGSANTFFFRHSKRTSAIPCKSRSFYKDEKNEVKELRHANNTASTS